MEVSLFPATITDSVACNGISQECNLSGVDSKKNGPKECLVTPQTYKNVIYHMTERVIRH